MGALFCGLMCSRGVALLVLAAIVCLSCLGAVPPAQRQALVNLYNAAGGPTWTSSVNWNVGDPCDNSWEFVDCGTLKTNILRLLLSGNKLSGTLVDLNLPALSAW